MPASDLRLKNIYALALEPRRAVPLLRGWNRLEGRPRIPDFERSLKAEVRDPLWFLTRQWQFGEFQGEDAASPIDVALGVRSAPIAFMRVGATEIPYDPTVPIETRVEREPAAFDLTFHMQGSRYLLRLLVKNKIGVLLAKFVTGFPLKTVAGEPSPDATRLQLVGAAFLVDIAALLASIRGGTFAAASAAMTASPTELASLKKTGDELVDWFNRTYGEPRSEPSAWRPERLSYQFECRPSVGVDGVSLIADEYRGGTMDWYSFDAATPQQPQGPSFDSATLSFLPTGIEFAGMPSIRFWEMEDGRTEFGHIDANTNDVAKLLVSEFMLLFSNDWCVVPLELNIGSFARLDGLLVTDVFGDQTWVRAANRGAGADWHHWSMYPPHRRQLPQPRPLPGPRPNRHCARPRRIEEVQFIRDEMANLVWAIEKRVASSLGEGVLLAAEADASRPLSFRHRNPLPSGDVGPRMLAPFLPVHMPGSLRRIRLQRARLPGPIHEPKSEVLRVEAPVSSRKKIYPGAAASFKDLPALAGTTEKHSSGWAAVPRPGEEKVQAACFRPCSRTWRAHRRLNPTHPAPEPSLRPITIVLPPPDALRAPPETVAVVHPKEALEVRRGRDRRNDRLEHAHRDAECISPLRPTYGSRCRHAPLDWLASGLPVLQTCDGLSRSNSACR